MFIVDGVRDKNVIEDSEAGASGFALSAYDFKKARDFELTKHKCIRCKTDGVAEASVSGAASVARRSMIFKTGAEPALTALQ